MFMQYLQREREREREREIEKPQKNLGKNLTEGQDGVYYPNTLFPAGEQNTTSFSPLQPHPSL